MYGRQSTRVHASVVAANDIACQMLACKRQPPLCPPQAIKATPRKTGIIILGGGVPKHHVNNANLFRNGADFAVNINTAQEYDGSDSGARPDEAMSWGKIRIDASPVKVIGDATILLPLLISQTFAKRWHAEQAVANGNKAK